MKTGSALSATGLSIGFPGGKNPVILFQDLTLQLNAGQLVCLMGPNGIGKSTLIRTLAGLQKPVSGKLSPIDATSVSVVLTDKIISSNMTVYDLVCYGRYPYLDWALSLSASDKEIIDTSLRQVNITNIADQPLHELSDGQMQMAMIARALAQDTPVLLLDEPTAHLDLNNRVETMDLLRRLAHNSGKAILLASHELDLALQTADQVWLATQSKTIKTGIPEDLVLDGSFDEVFQFKGFDLRTGKVNHTAYRGVEVSITGDGHELLWTRNALERNGFGISSASKIVVAVGGGLWRIDDRTFTRLEDVIQALTLNAGQ